MDPRGCSAIPTAQPSPHVGSPASRTLMPNEALIWSKIMISPCVPDKRARFQNKYEMDPRGRSEIPVTQPSPHVGSPASGTLLPNEALILVKNHDFPLCTG